MPHKKIIKAVRSVTKPTTSAVGRFVSREAQKIERGFAPIISLGRKANPVRGFRETTKALRKNTKRPGRQ